MIGQIRADRKQSGREIGGGIRNGPRVGIRTRGAHSVMVLYVDALLKAIIADCKCGLCKTFVLLCIDVGNLVGS